MKLFSTVVVSSCLAAQAFGVTPVVSQTKGLGKPALVTNKSPLRQKNVAELSPLFRDPTVTRGGAIPGLQAYSDALDKNPITMKALTSLVGWFLGDLLAQVSAGEYDGVRCNGIVLVLSISFVLISPSLSCYLCPNQQGLHRWRARRLQASCDTLILRIHLPRPIWTLLLQLA